MKKCVKISFQRKVMRVKRSQKKEIEETLSSKIEMEKKYSPIKSVTNRKLVVLTYRTYYHIYFIYNKMSFIEL